MENKVNNYLKKVTTKKYEPKTESETNVYVSNDSTPTAIALARAAEQKHINQLQQTESIKVLIHKDDVIASTKNSVLIRIANKKAHGVNIDIWFAKKQVFVDFYTNYLTVYIKLDWAYTCDGGQTINGRDIKKIVAQ